MTVCGRTGHLSSKERMFYRTVCGRTGQLSSKERMFYRTVCGITGSQEDSAVGREYSI